MNPAATWVSIHRWDGADGVREHVEVLLGGVGDGDGVGVEQLVSGSGSTASGSTRAIPGQAT